MNRFVTHFTIGVCALVSAAPAIAADLALYHDQQATMYIGEGKYYVDKHSIHKHVELGFPYFTAIAVGVEPGRPISVEHLAVVCNNPQVGYAQTYSRLGIYESGRVKFSSPTLSVTSIASFRPPHLEQRPDSPAAKRVLLICSAGASG